MYLQSCEGGQGECVPYYLCANGTLITDGDGLIDIRIDNDEEEECGYFDTCCPFESVKTETDVREAKAGIKTCGYRNVKGVGFQISGDSDGEAMFGQIRIKRFL